MTSFFKSLFFISVTVFFLFYSCSPLRHFSDLSQEADLAWKSKNYPLAYDLYGQLVDAHRSRDMAVDGEVLNRAGISAFEVGDVQRALDYLELARHTDAVNERTYAVLAKAYRDVDNLSREITNLERYIEHYPTGEKVDVMRERYFETLIESMNWQQAIDLWDELPENRYQDESLLTQYLRVNRHMNHEAKASDLADMLLDINKNNTEALDFLGRRHFQEAVSRHSREVRAYEQNRTHRQYAQLLEAFEIINTDLQIAMNYFKRLYDLDPQPEYAGFLANIYERFQDEENARYYRRLAD